jgi:arylformamidase
MLAGGKTIDEMPLMDLITKCRVIDLTHVNDAIEEHHLINQNIKKGEFILFKTQNSENKDFNPEFVYLASSGADGLGIERSQTGHKTHKILFNNNIHILEGLNLGSVEEGNYTLIALPLKIENADASPVRAVLIEDINIKINM